MLSIGGEVRIYELSTGSYKVIGAGIHPSWSPDGRWIAWKNLNTGGSRLDLKTGNKVEIMPGEAISYGFQWSPDSQWLMGCWKRLHMFGDTTIFVHRIADGENVNILDMVNGMTNLNFGWVVADPGVTLREA